MRYRIPQNYRLKIEALSSDVTLAVATVNELRNDRGIVDVKVTEDVLAIYYKLYELNGLVEMLKQNLSHTS